MTEEASVQKVEAVDQSKEQQTAAPAQADQAQAQPKKRTITKEELKRLRLAKAKAMSAAHGTDKKREANINSRSVQESVDQVNKDFSIAKIVAEKQKEEKEKESQPQTTAAASSTPQGDAQTETSGSKDTIDFTLLRRLQAQKETNQLSKKLTRQCMAIVMGMVTCYATSAGYNHQLNLFTFLLFQATLWFALETLEKYQFTNKIEAIKNKMKKDESSEFKLPGIVGQLANLAERANQAKGYFNLMTDLIADVVTFIIGVLFYDFVQTTVLTSSGGAKIM